MTNKLILTIVLICFLIFLNSKASAEDTPEVKSLLNKGKYIPDIETFLQISNNLLAGYSWDGTGVFFLSLMSGAPQIFRITEDGWPYQLTTFEDGIDVFSRKAHFSLSHNGKMAIVGASVRGSEQSQLYLMDTNTGRVVTLTCFEDVQIGTAAWSPDDRYIYYRSNEENGHDFFIYKLDINTGDSKKVFGDTSGVKGYNAIADISNDGNYILIYHLISNVDNDLYLLELSTGKYQKLTEDDKTVKYASATLMPNNKIIWLTCNDNDDGISRLATITVGSPEVEFIDDGWINPKWEIDELLFSGDYQYMTALVNEDGYLRMKIREVETRKELPSPPLDGILGGGIFDKNGTCLISFTGPTRAPDIWSWNPHTGELKQLTFSIYAGIDRTMFRPPKLVHYQSFDGLEIPAFLYLPPDYQEGEPIPFVVNAHGGPESQFKPYFIRNFQYMMLNGYGVFAPNPRGSSGYDRKFVNLDNYKNRKNSLRDYKAGVEWLIENSYTKKGMIGIRGRSYGGYVVLGMITEYPDLFSAALDEVGIANFKTYLENTKPYRRGIREAEYGPLSDSEFLESISPIHKAHMIKTPLLVVHGENDSRVPVSEARQIIEAIKINSGIVDSLIFPDEGHGTSKRKNIIALYRRQMEFFDRYLKVNNVKKETK